MQDLPLQKYMMNETGPRNMTSYTTKYYMPLRPVIGWLNRPQWSVKQKKINVQCVHCLFFVSPLF